MQFPRVEAVQHSQSAGPAFARELGHGMKLVSSGIPLPCLPPCAQVSYGARPSAGPGLSKSGPAFGQYREEFREDHARAGRQCDLNLGCARHVNACFWGLNSLDTLRARQ